MTNHTIYITTYPLYYKDIFEIIKIKMPRLKSWYLKEENILSKTTITAQTHLTYLNRELNLLCTQSAQFCSQNKVLC